MNRRASKLLRPHASLKNYDLNAVKKAWIKTPSPARYKIREAIKAELEQVAD